MQLSPRKAIIGLEILLAAIALSILTITTLISVRDWREFQRLDREAAHTRQVLETADALLDALKDAESGQRGFIITGDAKYLDPYNAALAVIPDQLRTLVALSADEPAQVSRVK